MTFSHPTRRRSTPSPIIRLLGGRAEEDLPLHRRVYRQLRDHILGGTLEPGARLPSARALAADLGVSRNTVEAALAQLGAEGYIRRRTGSGTYVSGTLGASVALPETGGSSPEKRRALRDGSRALSDRGRLTARLGASEMEADSQLGPCATDVGAFPLDTWNRLLARRARKSGTGVLLPADSRGVSALRDAIAEYLRLARGLRCEGSHVVVLSSTQQAVDLTARLLLEPGMVAAMEEPGYPGARAALRAAGIAVKGVAVDGEGLIVAALGKAPSPRLVYVTPSHQYPLGVTMSLCRRLELLRWAVAAGAWILEDDYDSEFRYDARPLAALQGLDTAGRTLYAGTFNKVLFPGLRIAYLVLPDHLVDAFAAARRVLDGFTPPLLQLVLADFIAEGHFTTHLRVARERYLSRRDALLAMIAEHWGGRVRLGPTDTGLHAVAHLSRGADDERIARSAPEGGMWVGPLSHYYMEGRTPHSGLLLNYAAATPELIARTIRRLAPALPRPSRASGT